MIGEIVAHCRGERDAIALDRHLWKAMGQIPRLIECANVDAPNSLAAMRVMMQMRDGAPRARTAAWHIVVSPRDTVTEVDARKIITAVVTEFAAMHHPRVVWLHAEKPRNKQGGAPEHLHIVLAHVGPALKALNMRHAIRRLEKTMRILEADLGEPPTQGWHHVAVVAALQRGGQGAVAKRLVAAHGPDPSGPRARMTVGMRAAAARAGFDLPELVAAIERCWEESKPVAEGARMFVSGLEALAVRVEPGQRPGAVALYRGSIFVGALHRLIGPDAAIIAAQLTQDRGGYDGRQTRTTAAGVADPSGAGARWRAGSWSPVDGDARSGRQGGIDRGGDPRDTGERGGERRGRGSIGADPCPRRTGRGAATHRDELGEGGATLGRAVLLLIAGAMRADSRKRIAQEAQLLTRAGRIAARDRLVARIVALLARTRSVGANLPPPMPEDYLPARAALVQAEEAVRLADAHRRSKVAIDAPARQREGVRGGLWSRRQAVGAATASNEAHDRDYQQALDERERAVAAMKRILATHARNTAACETRQEAQRTRLARRRATLKYMMRILKEDDHWAARGVGALLQEVGHRRLSEAPKGRKPSQPALATFDNVETPLSWTKT